MPLSIDDVDVDVDERMMKINRERRMRVMLLMSSVGLVGILAEDPEMQHGKTNHFSDSSSSIPFKRIIVLSRSY